MSPRAITRTRASKVGCNQTFLVFHFPCRNSTALMTARVENATVIAMNTPDGPMSNTIASTYANGISHSQKTRRLIHVGVHVSPAPLKALVSTIPYAYNGKPMATVRRHVTA